MTDSNNKILWGELFLGGAWGGIGGGPFVVGGGDLWGSGYNN